MVLLTDEIHFAIEADGSSRSRRDAAIFYYNAAQIGVKNESSISGTSETALFQYYPNDTVSKRKQLANDIGTSMIQHASMAAEHSSTTQSSTARLSTKSIDEILEEIIKSGKF